MILTEIVYHLVNAYRNFIITKTFVNRVKFNVINVNIRIAIVRNVTNFQENYILNNKNNREDVGVRKDSILNRKKAVKNANICAFKIVPNIILIVNIIANNVLKIT